MAYCVKCGFKIEEQNKFCPKCGAPQREDDDFTQIIPKEEFTKITTKNHEKNNGSSNNYIKPIILVVLAGVVILASRFAGYYFYNKNNTSSILQGNSTNTTETTENNKDSITNGQETEEKNTKETNKSNDYIFLNSDSIKFTDNQLNSLSKENLALARNEIYARHGYLFQTEPYKSYFNNKTWYKANSNFKGSDEELNEVERYNVQLTLKYEDRK